MLESRGSVARRAGSYLLGLAIALGCQKVDHPPPALEDEHHSPAPDPDGGLTLPDPGGDASAPAPDGSVICGGEHIQAVVDRPNLYFVIDASGSMADLIKRSSSSKYVAARRAIGSMLRAIGHRVRYGAMIFPASSGESSCDSGKEIFPLSDGDPLGDRDLTENGPVLQALLNRLANRGPAGATPTAASLSTARELLAKQSGRRYVILATDGAPNCGQDLTCPDVRCIPDIEGFVLSGSEPKLCGVDLNCCAPGIIEDPGRTLCIDDLATFDEVAALASQGIPTYVIGMPGSEAYASVLGRLAIAGGTARAGDLPYYAVTDEPELTDALFDIGTGLTIGCEIALDSKPEDAGLLNLYFDRALVPQDTEKGWAWTDDAVLTLRGEACRTLQSGNISEVEVVYGCRTVVR